MPQNLADDLSDRFLTHTIDVLRFEAHERAKVLALLKQLESQLIAALYAHDPTGVARTAWQQRRLEALLVQVTKLLQTAYREIHGTIRLDLQELARLEAATTMQLMNTAIAAPLLSVGLNAAQLTSVVDDSLILGAPAKAWWASQASALRQRFANEVRQGTFLGEGIDRLVQRVRGSKAASYTDGVLNLSRREGTALVRSSVMTVMNQAKLAIFKANADVLDGITWTSAMDSRVCVVCGALDGKQFSLPDYQPIGGHDLRYPGPVAHWNCRCTSVPTVRAWSDLVKDQDLSKRLKAALRQLPDSTRASMDGQIPASLDYESWLKRKSEAFQKQVLGVGRWEVWQQGKLGFEDLISQNNRPLTVAQLRETLA
jgi:SPP1 gp7 family putative phage head morphogenesis protein